MFGCVLSQLKPSELYILSCEKSLASTLFIAKNVELLGFHPILKGVIIDAIEQQDNLISEFPYRIVLR